MQVRCTKRHSIVIRWPSRPSPPGTPKRVLSQSPGLRRRRRYPGYRRKVRHNPEGGCAEGSNGCLKRVWSDPDSEQSFLDPGINRTIEPDPIPALLVVVLAGTNGTTPFGVGNALCPGPGVARRPAQPRAVWHNAFGVRNGVCGRSPVSRLCGKISRRGAEKRNLGSLRLGVSARSVPFDVWHSRADAAPIASCRISFPIRGSSSRGAWGGRGGRCRACCSGAGLRRGFPIHVRRGGRSP